MRENFSDEQEPLPGDYPLQQMLLRPFQQELAQQGIDVLPEEAYELIQQQRVHHSKLYLQRELSKEGVEVSPDEAGELFDHKILYDLKVWAQRELVKEGIDVSPEEAAELLWQRTLTHIFLANSGVTDPHEVREGMATDESSNPY